MQILNENGFYYNNNIRNLTLLLLNDIVKQNINE